MAEVASIRQEIRTAMQSKDYQSAIACCGRGLAMDGEDRKLHAAMYANRARAYGVPIRVVLPTRARHQLCPPRDWLRLPYHPRVSEYALDLERSSGAWRERASAELRF
eukprot:COSAG01_NODE_5538_length_4199_cov_2.920244_4_plen_108_part_00